MPAALLALGANLGDRAANLRAALEALPPHARVVQSSPVYETAPQYVTDQPRFLNMAAQVETELSPVDLLQRLKSIEHALGRTATRRYGPRVIDIDILFYADETVSAPTLQIPHPRIAERAFVLRPLADIAPDWVHPTSGQTVADMLADLPDDGGIELISLTLD
ncbi:MAG: 2-amino-4-hydroxy-6-hydroxymethyldihydropteridine diphosphokinase [Anaerolineales bacterium]